MLKIVPDPPQSTFSPERLEDTLVQTSEHVRCALAVAHQSLCLTTQSPASFLTLAALHEMETVRTLLEFALTQVQQAAQMSDTPRNLH